jgi:hypothetical protein
MGCRYWFKNVVFHRYQPKNNGVMSFFTGQSTTEGWYQIIKSNINENALNRSGKYKLLEETYNMANFKLVAPFCGVRKYDKRFFVYYLETEENIRREYIFNTDEDVSNFSHALENLTAFMKNVPVRKKEAYHQEFLDLLLKEVDHKLTIRTTSPDEAAIAIEA